MKVCLFLIRLWLIGISRDLRPVKLIEKNEVWMMYIMYILSMNHFAHQKIWTNYLWGISPDSLFTLVRIQKVPKTGNWITGAS